MASVLAKRVKDVPHYLVLDQGSHASKAMIFDAQGEVTASAEVAVATHRSGTDRVEHDADEIVASLQQAIREAHRRSGLGAVRLAGAGLATQRSSVVCWDGADGAALSPVLSWQDRRNAEGLAGLKLDDARVREISGLVVSPHYGASKLRWCLEELPAVRRARAAQRLQCGPLASFVLHRLLEERPSLVDPANAARTLLWDLDERDWSDELLAAFDIPRECLPRCVPSRHAFGTLRVGELEAPLCVATGDQPAAVFAWGQPSADTLFVNIGTGAFVQRLFDGAVPVVPGLLRGIAWQDGEHSIGVLEGTVNGAGAALDWLAAERGVPVEELFENAPRWLREVEDPPRFSNGVGGLGSPYWDASYPIGFSEPASLAAETVAVLESIVALLQANIEAMAGAVTEAPPPTRIIISGGLARLDGLCERLAERSGLAIERPAAFEATAHGLAWLLHHRVGPQ